MSEYRFDLNRPVPSGRVVFRVQNAGHKTHHLAILALSDDVPPLEQQLRGRRRLQVFPFAGVAPRQPGARGTFAADLPPGRRYAMICLLDDRDGPTHALQGMHLEFRPAANPSSQGPTAESPAPPSSEAGSR